MADTEMVRVDPGPGQMEQVAAALIRLADHPHDVVWRSRGAFFLVPEQVAVRYAAETAAAGGQAEPAEAKPRTRRRASSKAPAADSKPAAPAKEPAKPRSRASRSSKKKGGDS